jgi:hypothetical protein
MPGWKLRLLMPMVTGVGSAAKAGATLAVPITSIAARLASRPRRAVPEGAFVR